jgi:rhamnogalacturonan endolyase
MLGDWREEVILPDQTKLKDIKIFSTWYPTEHRIPWLMTDHTYYMQCVHEQVGYNQPTNLGYYLGSDYTSDADIWAAASKADQAIRDITDGIHDIVIESRTQRNNSPVYNLNGVRVNTVQKGIYIKNGKKFVVK